MTTRRPDVCPCRFERVDHTRIYVQTADTAAEGSKSVMNMYIAVDGPGLDRAAVDLPF